MTWLAWAISATILGGGALIGLFLWWLGRVEAAHAPPRHPARCVRPVGRPQRHRPAARCVSRLAPPPATAPDPASSAPLPWEHALDQLRQAPHVLVVGASTAGKSTLAQALAVTRAATDQLVIINPHQRPGDYGDLPQARTYAEIQALLTTLLALFEARKADAFAGAPPPVPLTIIIEEAPDILSRVASADGRSRLPKVPIARRCLGELLRQGAKYGMRLVVVTQSTQVRTLGIEGERDVLDNLVWVLLGAQALARCPAAASLARPAAVVLRQEAQAFDATPAAPLARQPLAPTVVAALTTPPASRPETVSGDAETPMKPRQEPDAVLMTTGDSAFTLAPFLPLARLIVAGMLTETAALKHGWGVKPGGSQDYQQARAQLKAALALVRSDADPEMLPEAATARQAYIPEYR